MELKWTWTVVAGAAEGRADLVILRALAAGQGTWEGLAPDASPPALTRSQLQRLIAEGQVTAGGKPLRAGVSPGGDVRIELRVPAPRPLALVPEDRPLEILHEDAHVLVLNKPPGLTVHPSETQTEGTLVHALLHHVRDLSGIGGVLRPGIVHRLDKDTSGALVITKTDAAHRALSEVFSRHAIEREYWALCYGALAADAGADERRVESLIGRSNTDRKKMSMQVERGRRSVTFLKPLESYGQGAAAPFASLVRARLETGRTHQVRVHLAGIGHSVLGDPVYGVPSRRNSKWLALPEDVRLAVAGMPGQALHARVLGFDHPVTGQRLRFEAPPPESFRLLLAALRRYFSP